ncbi:hypothetical protein NBO_84g0013 [Nosema bombycis CQ1]|uniref:Uncharacterized protein n=1 Tax=Nosema bombycis (strain CQ1 / CVCC 102059) TaxID=578461 RepID=R0MGQ1_NOSB1|nr:hypothetical protein NBO_84g0013 [Nosema bombycis CQ1]|eukprot:EOB13295.1 hypothetical protein NBO_84g0013 [Nosema bombycis CQ1]
MLFKKVFNYVYLYIISVCDTLPLGEPVFAYQDGSDKILLPFKTETDITKYDIYESKIGEAPDYTSSICNSDKINFKNNILKTEVVDILYIDIGFIDREKGFQYTVCVTLRNGEVIKFKPFIWDKTEVSFKLIKTQI